MIIFHLYYVTAVSF